MARKGKDDDDDRDDDRDDEHNHDHDNHDHNAKKYVSKLPNRKYGYFRDDQVVFFVTHDQDQLSEKDLEDFESAITPRLRELGIEVLRMEAISFRRFRDQEVEQCRQLLAVRANKIVSDEDVNNSTGAFSIIKCDLKNTPEDPIELIRIVERLTEKPPDSSVGLTLQGTSLNWLASVAAQGSGTGGPGGKPVPYIGSRKNAPYCFDIVTQLQNKKIYGNGVGVDVVILDTAPCAQALVSAYKEWPDHPLISTLLGPQGKLSLYPATYDELLRLACTSLNEHDYRMTDHGLFIAGIIHSIVPEAEIHLVEVLNQYGVGDMTSFTQGLQTVFDEIYNPGRKLVINCSWMLELPFDDTHCRPMDCMGELDAEFVRVVCEFAKNDQATPHMLRVLFDRFFVRGRQAFASAGNDGRKGDKDRVQARYPAALKSVTGVGALPKSLEKVGAKKKKYRTSVFSNLSEQPDKRGVVTRGVVTLGGEEGEGNGVLGLYIGEFPGGYRNESKWAWWSGTSFATPIIVGAVASILSRRENSITRTQDAFTKLHARGVKIIKDGQAGKQEDALPVTQS